MRGMVSDQAWGLTLGGLGARKFTGQLLLQADGRQYGLAFDSGDVIGATSPAPADAVARIAMTNHLVTSTQVPDLMRRLTAAPEREDIDVLAEAVHLSADQVKDLRAKVIVQRAARTFSVEDGEYILLDEIAMPITPGTRIPIGAVIHLGVRMNLSEQRLAADLRALGSQFTLGSDGDRDLQRFGIDPIDLPIIDALRAGTSLPALEAIHRDVDPRTMQAIIYTLVACGACAATRTTTLGQIEPPVVGRAPTGQREWQAATGTPPASREWNTALGTPADLEAGSAGSNLDIGRAPTKAQRGPIGTNADDPDISRAPTRPRETSLPSDAAVSRAFTKPGSGVPERTAATPRTATRTAPESFRTPASRPPPPETWIPVSELRDPAPPAQARTRTPVTPSRTPTGERKPPFSGVSEPPKNPFANNPQPRTVTPTASEVRAVPRVTTPPRSTTSIARTATPVPVPSRTATPTASDPAPRTTPGRTPTTSAPPRTTTPRTATTSRAPTPTSTPRTPTPGSTPPAPPRTTTPMPVRPRPESNPAVTFSAPQKTPLRSRATGQEADTPPDPSVPRTPSAEWSEPKLDATPNSAAVAEEAFKRGERALKRDDVQEAVAALKEAFELNPKNFDYHATYVWAQFCAASDKERVASDLRKALERSIYRSEHPEVGRFYLGKIERMLGRDKEALRHFQEVLLHKPNHREAQGEIRIIELRLSSGSKR